MKIKIRPQCRRRKESKFKPKRIIAHTHTYANVFVGMRLLWGRTLWHRLPLCDKRKIAICSFCCCEPARALLTIFLLASYARSLPLAFAPAVHLRLLSASNYPHFSSPSTSSLTIRSRTPNMCMLLTFVCRILANRKILYRIWPFRFRFPRVLCIWLLLLSLFWLVLLSLVGCCCCSSAARVLLKNFHLIPRIGFSCAYCAFRISLHI